MFSVNKVRKKSYEIKIRKMMKHFVLIFQGKSVLLPSDVERKNALAAALTEIIYNVSPNKVNLKTRLI